jgi:hypothetical protein
MRRGTRFARVHGATLLDPPQLNAIRQGSASRDFSSEAVTDSPPTRVGTLARISAS